MEKLIYKGHIKGAPRYLADQLGSGVPHVAGQQMLDLLLSDDIWSPEQKRIRWEKEGDVLKIFLLGEEKFDSEDWWKILTPIQ